MVVLRLDVGAGGTTVGVSQRLRDGFQTYIALKSKARPRAARGVRRQVLREAGLPAKLRQLRVVGCQPRLVLDIGSGGVRAAQQRKDIVALRRAVLADDLLHTGLEVDADALARLVAVVHQRVALNLRLAHERHVDERHAHGRETEQEQVARLLHGRAGSKI